MSEPLSLTYPSLVDVSDNLTSVSCGRIVHNNTYHVTQGQEVCNSSFVHDESGGTSTEIQRDSVVMDPSGDSASMYLGVLHETDSIKTLQPVIKTSSDKTTLTSVNSTSVYNLTLDGSISWDTDSASLYLSSNKNFRFRYVESDGINPSRLALEGLNDLNGLYDPKVEFTTD